MLKCFDKFRKQLDEIMTNAFGKRIILYGHGRTGRFLEWYAEYYHSIKPDFIITSDWSNAMPYSLPYFRDSLFEFNYADVKNAIVWLALPGDKEAIELCKKYGFEYYDFADIIYGDKLIAQENTSGDIFTKKKTGAHDVQFMEYLECFYDCNFVTSVSKEYLTEGAHNYAISAQMEIFPILDKCHMVLSDKDSIFDFGCGKGGAMLTFLDYGFKRVGGVEYSGQLYEEAKENFKKIQLDSIENLQAELIHRDAAKVTQELDNYNWFYFFDPFERQIFEPVILNICDSYRRKPRKLNLICINPRYYEEIEKSGIFVMTNQFCAATRQKVVNIYTTKE
ncbi:MAG: class I SAM-dependent methyltransferase [Lachnospiraceae bacterium]|nr:class I SAM-dependent methyltransferase [uncultured Acetatifactor sp.]MCI8287929.1 class I SAM-dependent methyltransferase [Lachnospiraceae bacterium]